MFTKELLMFSQADSLVSRTAQRASAKAKTMIVTSGPTCYELFEKSDLPTSWAKMFSGLLLGMGAWYSKRCVLNWKLKVTPYSRLLFQLAPSVLPTEEIEYGLLPTPKASDLERGNRKLDENGLNVNSKGVRYGAALPQLAKSGLLPTPKCQEARGNASIDRGKANLTDVIASIYKPTGKTSQLNPLFVAEMMGFPPNWTVLPFQSGEEKA
jgi:hypothetical protein